MIDEKNNVTFHISEQLSMLEKISSEMEIFFKLWIRDSRDPSVLHKEEWRGNSVKKSDITNWSMLAYMVVKESSSYVEKEQGKPR